MYKKIIIIAVAVIFAGLYSLYLDGEHDNQFTPSTALKAQIELVENLPVAQFKFVGKARLSDGDSLQFAGEAMRVRLFAIDSPELAQECSKNQQNWQCGQAAKQALQQRIDGGEVSCVGDEKDRYERLLATCYLTMKDGKYLDLNAWQVKNGWAIAYVYYSKRYVSEQKFAKKQKLGIWQGSFLEPFKWRQQNNR
ncbi:MAG: succinoglycan biosynthesis protein [Hyphomicrobiales bacterium]|nr:MAG: succinoglycan biosynthesis protein [Hyphomicrobiales bacterium]